MQIWITLDHKPSFDEYMKIATLMAELGYGPHEDSDGDWDPTNDCPTGFEKDSDGKFWQALFSK